MSDRLLSYVTVLGFIVNFKASGGLIMKRDANCNPGTYLSGSQFKYLCYPEGESYAYKPIACITAIGKVIPSGQTYIAKNFEYLCTIDDVAKTASYQIGACYSAGGAKMAVGSKVSEKGLTYSCASNNGSVTLTFGASTSCFYGGNEYQPKAVWLDSNGTTQLACISSSNTVGIQTSGCVAPDSSVISINGFKQINDSGFLTCVTQKTRTSLVGIQNVYCSDNVSQHILGSNWTSNGYNYQCGLVNLTAATVGISCIIPGTSKALVVGYAQAIKGVWFQCRSLASGLLQYSMIAIQNCTVGNNTYNLSTKYVLDNVQYQCSFDTAGKTFIASLQCLTNNQTVVPINGIVQESSGVAYQCIQNTNGATYLHPLSDVEYSLWKTGIQPGSISAAGASGVQLTFTTTTTTTTPQSTVTTPATTASSTTPSTTTETTTTSTTTSPTTTTTTTATDTSTSTTSSTTTTSEDTTTTTATTATSATTTQTATSTSPNKPSAITTDVQGTITLQPKKKSHHRHSYEWMQCCCRKSHRSHSDEHHKGHSKEPHKKHSWESSSSSEESSESSEKQTRKQDDVTSTTEGTK